MPVAEPQFGLSPFGGLGLGGFGGNYGGIGRYGNYGGFGRYGGFGGPVYGGRGFYGPGFVGRPVGGFFPIG